MFLCNIAVGFLIGTMAGMGIGGGGLLVIYLTLVGGVPQLTAQGTNLYFFIIASAASLLVHVNRRRIEISHIAPAAAAGMIFAFVGSRAADILPEELIRRLFGIMLTVSGALVLLRSLRDAVSLSGDEDE